MLVDIEAAPEDAVMGTVLAAIGRGNGGAERIGRGQYRIQHFSFGHMLPRGQWEDYGEIGSIQTQSYGGIETEPANSYGVCDSPEQFMATVGPFLEASPDEYVVSFTPIRKADQPPDGGWRWHKWGPYIGEHRPQCEYIYDEPAIDEVYVYHFFRRLKPGEKARW